MLAVSSRERAITIPLTNRTTSRLTKLRSGSNTRPTPASSSVKDQEGIVVFNIAHPRTTTARAQSTGRRIAAATAVIAVTGALTLAGAGAATAAPAASTADPIIVSWAEGRFLSGSLLGLDLDDIASLAPATASNDGTQGTQTQKDPLDAKVLDTVEVAGNVQADLGNVVQVGAAGQYAEAASDGKSAASSGAVNSDGAVGVGEDQAGAGGNARVDLSGLLGSDFTSNLIDLDLAIQAIAAQAQADGETASGDYTLADLKMTLSSPAIAQLTEKVNSALDSVTNSLNLLDGDNGALVVDLNRILQGIDPALNLLGANANVTAEINVGDLKQLVSDLLTQQYGQSGVTFNLETGIVTLDLAALAGVDLNNLPAGTELLSDEVLGDALDNITDKVSGIADQVVDRVTDALHDATVEVHANVDLDVAQAPLVQKVCQTVQQVIQVPTQVVQTVPVLVPVVDGVVAQVVNGVPVLNGVPIVGNLVGGSLGGLLGGTTHTVTWITQNVTKTVTQLVNQTVDQVVCNNKVTALPALKTSADVDITGTVDDFLNGADVNATAAVKLLGIVNTNLNLDLAVGDIADSLTDGLFGTDGTVSALTDALQVGLVDPAVEGLLDGDNALGVALPDLLSLTVNNKEISDGTFTETALRVSALNGAAVVNLAAASVGPNVIEEVGGETVTPPDEPPTGDVPASVKAAVLSRLAMTGAGIAAIVAVMLALLAAGAYLVRENYRRNKTIPID
jgi:hypothetical protein